MEWQLCLLHCRARGKSLSGAMAAALPSLRQVWPSPASSLTCLAEHHVLHRLPQPQELFTKATEGQWLKALLGPTTSPAVTDKNTGPIICTPADLQ